MLGSKPYPALVWEPADSLSLVLCRPRRTIRVRWLSCNLVLTHAERHVSSPDMVCSSLLGERQALQNLPQVSGLRQAIRLRPLAYPTTYPVFEKSSELVNQIQSEGFKSEWKQYPLCLTKINRILVFWKTIFKKKHLNLSFTWKSGLHVGTRYGFELPI